MKGNDTRGNVARTVQGSGERHGGFLCETARKTPFWNTMRNVKMLKFIIKETGGMAWIGLPWLTLQHVAGSCGDGN